MSLAARLARLDKVFRNGPGREDTRSGPRLSDAIRAIDGYIKRLQDHIEQQEKDPQGFWEDYDVERYGCTLREHQRHVDDICRQADERHEQWKREYRPDFVGRRTLTDDRIDELTAEIEEIEEEIRVIDNMGGGG